MDLDRDLNPQQREAVLYQGGPLLVLAGAGSGKTRVLTYRVSCLMRDRGLQPFQILAITFTNKAAGEMRKRVYQLLGEESQGMWIGTFHSSCARILRQHIDQMGLQRNFVIYDQADQLRAIKACFQRLGISDNRIRPIAVLAMLEKAKNQGLDTPSSLSVSLLHQDRLQALFEAYRSYLRESNALDFGDLILFVHRLLEEHPDLLAQYRKRFRSILVDEYQDTNRAQHLLLQTLVPRGGDLCVVGDDDQSIYRWRGAEVDNLLRFKDDFPGARILFLEQNYRSTGNILRAAGAVAQGNPNRHQKVLWTANEPGERIPCFVAGTSDDEARMIAREIRSLVSGGGVSYRDIGVLFRTNAQSRPFEEIFVPFQIPYAVVGSLRFYERAEIKDVLAYLRFLYNPRDSVSLQRILNRPSRGIGQATQDALTGYANERGFYLWEAIEQAVMDPSPLPEATKRKILGFRVLVRHLQSGLDGKTSIAGLIEEILVRTGYRHYLESQPDGERRIENLEELMRTAAEFEEGMEDAGVQDPLGAFLERLSLVTEVDQYSDRADCVTLMTLHCAKGLEFDTVFLTGMEEGILPHQRSSLQPEELAEERRLCYVGMTRARRKLYLSRAQTRTQYGERRQTTPSPFLDDLPADLLDFSEETESWERPDAQSSSFSSSASFRARSDFESELDYAETQLNIPKLPKLERSGRKTEYKVGDVLEHQDLGRGVVRKVEGAGDKEKITVHFQSAGIRKLMARVSPIRKLKD